MDVPTLNQQLADAKNLAATAYKEFLVAAEMVAEKLSAYKQAKRLEEGLMAQCRAAQGQPTKYESYDE